MEDKIYKQKTVREVLELGAPLMSTWLKAGYIQPAIPAKRRGHHAGYSVGNMVQIKVLDMLADAGVSLRKASDISLACDFMDVPIWYNLETGQHIRGLTVGNAPTPTPPEDWDLYLTVNVPLIRNKIQQQLADL